MKGREFETIRYEVDEGDKVATITLDRPEVLNAFDRRMCEEGVAFRNPPVEITAGANRGGYACYFHDPDGITIGSSDADSRSSVWRPRARASSR